MALKLFWRDSAAWSTLILRHPVTRWDTLQQCTNNHVSIQGSCMLVVMSFNLCLTNWPIGIAIRGGSKIVSSKNLIRSWFCIKYLMPENKRISKLYWYFNYSNRAFRTKLWPFQSSMIGRFLHCQFPETQNRCPLCAWLGSYVSVLYGCVRRLELSKCQNGNCPFLRYSNYYFLSLDFLFH